jgi:hypothetical protein
MIIFKNPYGLFKIKHCLMIWIKILTSHSAKYLSNYLCKNEKNKNTPEQFDLLKSSETFFFKMFLVYTKL